MRYNRYLPLLTAALTYIWLEIFYYNPQLVYVAYVFTILLFFFTARQFAIGSHRDERPWNYLILPAVFFTGLVAFSLLIPKIPNGAPIQALFILNTVFLYLYFRTIYVYLLKPQNYKYGAIENLSSYGNFLAFYFIISSIYGLQVFLNINIGWLIAVSLAITALILYQIIWANRIKLQLGMLYLLIISLVLAELVWSASFLTLSFYIQGLMIAIFYYIITGLARFHLLGKLTSRIVGTYLTFGLISIILVLLTSRWISYG